MKRIMLALVAILVPVALVFAQAGIAGKWKGEQTVRGVAQTVTMELKTDGGKLTGTFAMGQLDAVQIMDGIIDGNKISFTTLQNLGGAQLQIAWSAEVKGDELSLSRTAGGGGGRGGAPAGGAAAPAAPAAPRAGGPAPIVLKRTK